MKRAFYFLLIVFAALAAASCSKTKSYTDMLNDEKDAIDRLRDKEGLVFLKDFPKDSIFKENEFVKLDNGIYLNIIDQGKGDHAVMGSTILLVRYKVRFLLGQDTATYDNLSPTGTSGSQPEKFTYGYNFSINGSPFINDGLASILQYVRDSSSVKLIVPFKQMPSTYQRDGIGAYYEKVKIVYY